MDAKMIDNVLQRSHRVISPASAVLSKVTLILLAFIFIVQSAELFMEHAHNWQGSLSATGFAIISLVLMVLYVVRNTRHSFSIFTTYFLVSTFCMIIAWRICALLHLKFASYLYILPFFLKVINYVMCAFNDIRMSRASNHSSHHRSAYEWQLMTIRLIIGFDFIPHFTEKLFAGPHIRHLDVIAFQNLQVPHALFFVWLAGLIEFGGCFSIGCGFLTRLGAIGVFIYIMVAAYLGHHFSLGFIWASPGGGWEFPVLWGLLLLSFALFGGDAFSLDYVLLRRYKLPKLVRIVMGVRPKIN